MTSQLDILKQERQRLRETLADDPQWLALQQAQANLSAGKLPQSLTLAEAEALAEHPQIAAYLKVTDEIERLMGAPEITPDAATSAGPAPFRTRVSVKPNVAENRPADDLTKIRRVDRALAARLNGLGISRFETIAAWDRYEVRRVRDALDLGKRIWRENWIEQAALLHLRRRPVAAPVPVDQVESDSVRVVDPSHSVRLSSVGNEVVPVAGDRTAQEPRDVGNPDAKEQGPETSKTLRLPGFKVGKRPSRLPAPAARRFVYIRGVSDALAESMRAAGVNTFADISSWTRADVRWFQAILGDDARISRDQWIEQATLLSRGVWTRYALRVVNGETRSVVGLERCDSASLNAVAVPFPPVERLDAIKPKGGGGVEADATVEIESGDRAAAPVVQSIEPEQHARSAEMERFSEGDGRVEALEPKTPAAIIDSNVTDSTSTQMSAGTRLHPLRGLSTIVALGKIKRPPPDLGSKRRVSSNATETERQIAQVRVSPVLPPANGPAPPPLPRALAAVLTTGGMPPQNARPASNDAEGGAVGAEMQALPNEVATGRKEVEEFGTFAELTDDYDDDWDDAEALVIRRVDAEPSTRGAEDVAVVGDHAEMRPPISDAQSDLDIVVTADDSDGPLEWHGDASVGRNHEINDAVLGDEAQVTIVSKRRRTSQDGDGEANRDEASGFAGASVERETTRKTIVQRPEFVARRVQNVRPIDGDFDEPSAGYRDAVDEATVTIIRAEASATDAADIWPNEIANDTGLAEDDAEAQPERRRRGFGSRFLKALTGD